MYFRLEQGGGLADRTFLGSSFAKCHGYREFSVSVLCSSTKDERNDDSEEEREELDDDDDHNDRSEYQYCCDH